MPLMTSWPTLSSTDIFLNVSSTHMAAILSSCSGTSETWVGRSATARSNARITRGISPRPYPKSKSTHEGSLKDFEGAKVLHAPSNTFISSMYALRLVSVAEHKSQSPSSVPCFVLTVSDTRTLETETSGRTIAELLEAAGHTVAGRAVVRDEPAQVQDRVRAE